MAVAALNSDERNLEAVAMLLRASRAAREGSLQERVVEVTGGIPLYRVDGPAGGAEVLATARLQGWRYLVFDNGGGEALGTVEVEAAAAGEQPLAATLVNTGADAGEFVARLRTAGSAWNDGQFELRLIEIPSADAEAIWLSGPTSLFIDLIGPDSSRIETAEEFLARVRETIELRHQAENVGLDEISGGNP